jgi:ketosteroid isomerase-like protein
MSTNELLAEIESVVSKYADSIDRADADLASTIWSTTDDVSFINPRRHERGWEQVKKNFYEKTMRDTFTDRQLKIHDLKVHLYDNTALVEFYWDFNAILRSDGCSLRTQGRETQVYRRVGDRWLLVHVHYSGMPVSGEREGL